MVALLTVCCVGVAGCTTESSAGPEGEKSEAFSFTDDRGETVEVDAGELRIVAQEDAANALMHMGIKPVGIFGGAPLDQNPMLEGLDLSGIESVGEVFGEIKMEKLVELNPDVIVSTFYTGDGVLFEGGVYGFGTKKMQDDATEIAPILAIDSTQPSSQVIERFSEMAGAMGADVESGEVADQRAAWEESVEKLKATAAENKDQQVLAVTPDQSQVYFAVPDAFPDLLDMQDWGVDMMVPDGKLVSSYYEAASWENAAKYDPDVVLVDTRGYTLGTDELEKYPTWGSMDAVKDGNVGEWVRVSLNYEDYKEQVDGLTEVLNGTGDTSP
ncbi:MAG: ABC transporter substrate-binding protein [Nocardioidaceae bacterium]